MKLRSLALALAVLAAPLTASATTMVQLAIAGVNGGAPTTIPPTISVAPGDYQVTFRIVPDPVEKMAAYVANFEVTGGGALLPFTTNNPDDPFDPNTYTVYCTLGRPAASDNCSINAVLGSVTPDPANFGVAETLAVDLATAVNPLSFTVRLPAFAQLVIKPGSNVVLSDFSEVSIDGVAISAIPEPGTVLLLGAGLAGLAATRRKRA